MKSKNTLGYLPMNKIAHQDKNMITQAAILANVNTKNWGMSIKSLKKVVSRESLSGYSTDKVTG